MISTKWVVSKTSKDGTAHYIKSSIGQKKHMFIHHYSIVDYPSLSNCGTNLSMIQLHKFLNWFHMPSWSMIHCRVFLRYGPRWHPGSASNGKWAPYRIPQMRMRIAQVCGIFDEAPWVFRDLSDSEFSCCVSCREWGNDPWTGSLLLDCHKSPIYWPAKSPMYNHQPTIIDQYLSTISTIPYVWWFNPIWMPSNYHQPTGVLNTASPSDVTWQTSQSAAMCMAGMAIGAWQPRILDILRMWRYTLMRIWWGHSGINMCIMSVCMYICTYVCLHLCMYVCIYIYIYLNVYMCI